ncbi:hypothetical protein [Synechococcus sp. UW179A]|uniref:hypothetical protein n=1 Tax=Synechococcus sp. UW179A TaxID=2575510 RepID=UPI0010BE71AD|nr:hypothetical protein [Synechococcus sp. UW179A]
MPHITTWDAIRASLSAWGGQSNTKKTWIRKAKFTDAAGNKNVEQDALAFMGSAGAITKNALNNTIQDSLLVNSGTQYDLAHKLNNQAIASKGICLRTDHFGRVDVNGSLINRTPSHGLLGDGFVNEKTELLEDKVKGLDSNPGREPGHDGDVDSQHDNGCHRNYFKVYEEPLSERFPSSWDENHESTNQGDDFLSDFGFPFPSSDGDSDAPEPAPEGDTDGGGMTDPDDPMSVDSSPSEDDPEGEDGSQGGMSDPEAPVCEDPEPSQDVDQSSDNPMNDHQGDAGETPAIDNPNSDINWGPDGQNSQADSASIGFMHQLDPITNWGPDGKLGDAGFGLDIGIGVRDPHTNWGSEQHDEYYNPSGLINRLVGINPKHNESYDINSNVVESMTAVGNDFF